MKELFGSPYVRIAIGAVVSTWLTPKIVVKFVKTADPKLHDQAAIGTAAAVTTATFIVLGMLGGKSTVAAAAAA